MLCIYSHSTYYWFYPITLSCGIVAVIKIYNLQGKHEMIQTYISISILWSVYRIHTYIAKLGEEVTKITTWYCLWSAQRVKKIVWHHHYTCVHITMMHAQSNYCLGNSLHILAATWTFCENGSAFVVCYVDWFGRHETWIWKAIQSSNPQTRSSTREIKRSPNSADIF